MDVLDFLGFEFVFGEDEDENDDEDNEVDDDNSGKEEDGTCIF